MLESFLGFLELADSVFVFFDILLLIYFLFKSEESGLSAKEPEINDESLYNVDENQISQNEANYSKAGLETNDESLNNVDENQIGQNEANYSKAGLETNDESLNNVDENQISQNEANDSKTGLEINYDRFEHLDKNQIGAKPVQETTESDEVESQGVVKIINCLQMMARNPKKGKEQLKLAIRSLPEHLKFKYATNFNSLLERIERPLSEILTRKETQEAIGSKMVTYMQE